MIPHRAQRARDRYRITQPQEVYLRRLLNEAFTKLIPAPFNLDAHHLNNVTRETASAAIDRLKVLLAEHRAAQAAKAQAAACKPCADHYGDGGACDQGKPLASPHRTTRCADCGEVGERTGHMGCQYPQDHH